MRSRFSVSQAWNCPTAACASFAAGQEFGMVRFELPDQVLVPGDGPGRRDLAVGVAVADPVGGHQVPERQHGQLAAGVREVLAGKCDSNAGTPASCVPSRATSSSPIGNSWKASRCTVST